uniref:GAG-pre-integrase domain-containing protein n=1 Tax=Nicotiana tabacum TaxID=4097 RepID=A0A1S3XK56_TOBAC|nr:PREDICTED: uncharacterized protein LOC107766024 [Nicotiana tabacum]
MGLNDTYAPQMSQILTMHPTPTLDQAYSMIVQEGSQRVNVGTSHAEILGSTPLNLEISALVTANASNVGPRENNGLVCDYCHMKGHSRESCYKLVGYPPGFKFNNNRRRGTHEHPGNMAHNAHTSEVLQNAAHGNNIPAAVPTVQPFTTQQYQQILRMLSKETQLEDVENMVGNSLDNQCSWIIDSGASNYMVSSANLLSSFNPFSDLKYATTHLPNGNNTKITHIGTCNLPNSDDLFSGMVNGIGRLEGDLYILSPSTHAVVSSSKCMTTSVHQNTNALWHKRLGHAPLPSVGMLSSKKTFSPSNIPETSLLPVLILLLNVLLLIFFPVSDVQPLVTPSSSVDHSSLPADSSFPPDSPSHSSFSSPATPAFSHPPYSTDPATPTPSSSLVDSPSFLHQPFSQSLQPRKSTRTSRPPIWLTDYVHPLLPYISSPYPIQQFVSYSHLPFHFQSFLASFHQTLSLLLTLKPSEMTGGFKQ